MKNSYSFFTYILAVLASCSVASSPSTDLPQPTASTLHASALITHYGEITGSFKDAYFASLLTRLDPDIFSAHQNVHIINTPDPLAFLSDYSSWVISKGLIQKLRSEGELAFVLAHELGHQRLGHLNRLHHTTENGSSGYDLSLELEADQFALAMITKAGYPAESAVRSLLNFYSYMQDPSNIASSLFKPAGIPARIQALNETIRESRLAPGSRTAQREFRKLLASL